MNEELETAKEELQSTNEELTTVNDELHSRNQETSQVNSDLVNLLTTVDVPILILDRHRRIRRFTPKARSILNVLPSDVGRPFDDIKPNLDVPDLDQQIAEVIETDRRERVRGPGPGRTLVPDADPALQDDGQQDRWGDRLAGRHRCAQAPRQRRAARRRSRPSGRTAPRTSSWRRCPTSSVRRWPPC